MLQIIQLQDGCYHVTVDYSVDGFTIHREWIFAVTESDAEPMVDGEQIVLEWYHHQGLGSGRNLTALQTAVLHK